MQAIEKTCILDEALIERVVHDFYGRVRGDAMLGPIFEQVIGTDWDRHLARMVDFWSAVLLGGTRYAGRPHAAHQPLPLTRDHFAQWLAMFRRTVETLCAPDIASIFLDRAGRIASSLQAGMGIHPRAEYTVERSDK